MVLVQKYPNFKNLCWYGQTHLLVRGLEHVVPNLTLALSHQHGFDQCKSANVEFIESKTLLGDSPIKSQLNILAFEWTDELRNISSAHNVMLSSPELIEHIGDKSLLPEILDKANIDAIESVTICNFDRSFLQKIWCEFDQPHLVVQAVENSHIGRGTHKAKNVDELEALLKSFDYKSVKVAPFIVGELITSAACIGRHGDVTLSPMSQQICGLRKLTSHWASHCGNDIIDMTDDDWITASDITIRIGKELHRRGFKGIFGLDLIKTTTGEILPIEINPRMQSVTSLITATEIASNITPSVLHHNAAFSTDLDPPEATASPRSVKFSQLCLYNTAIRYIPSSLPTSGIYSIDTTNGLTLISPVGDLIDLEENNWVLVTMRVSEGEELDPHDRIAYLQFSQKLQTGDGNLRPKIQSFVDSFRTSCGLS